MRELGAALRGEFLLEPGSAFLNHGSFGATPRRVLDAQTAWRERMERQPVRFLDREYDAHLLPARDRLARFLSARPQDLVFTVNATTAVNAVLRSLDLRAGDELLTTTHVYGAVRNALRYVASRSGARVVEVEIPLPLDGPDQVLERLSDALGPRTRIAVLDHLTSPSALVLPVVEMVRLCHEHGVPVLVDGAHAPGQVPLDLDALGADWSTGNCHKWLFAPKGCAYLHAREGRQEIAPTVISHGYGKGLWEAFSWEGTHDPTAWLAVTEALDFLEELGAERVRQHNASLCDRATDLLAEAWGVEPGTPKGMRAAMCALPVPCEPTVEAGRALTRRLWEEHRIEVPVVPLAGRSWLRISAQVYNTIADYERLAGAIGGSSRV